MIRPRKPAAQPPMLNDVPLGIEGSQPIGMALNLEGIAPAPTVKPGTFAEGGKGRRVIGILGDALMAAGGGQPIYGPEMFQRARIQDDRNFAREQLAAKIAADREERMAKAMEPPAFVRNAQTYANLDPNTQRQVADFYSVTNPQFTNIEQADGSVMRVPVSRGPQMGPQPGTEEDGYVFMGGDPADPKNWKAR